MVDLVKKVNKHAGDLLQPGETVLGALGLQEPSGTLWTMGGAAMGGLAGMAIGRKLDKKARVKDEELRDGGGASPPAAAPFPTGGALVAVTDRRMIFFTMSLGKGAPKDVFLEMPLDQIDRMERIDRKASLGSGLQKTAAVRWVFKDGTIFDASAMVGGPAKKAAARFFEAYAQVRPEDGMH